MVKIILINAILYLSFIWNSIYLLFKNLTTKSQEVIDKNQFHQLHQIMNQSNTLTNASPNTLTNISPNASPNTTTNISTNASPNTSLTILNWNIHYFTDSEDNCTFINQFNYLKEKLPDIICLQEVKCKTFEIKNEKCNQLKCLAEKLGYFHIHINELAVLSKFKIKQHKFISDYPNSNSFGNRCILFRIELNNKEINILNLHLHNDLFGMEQLTFYYKYLKKLIKKCNETKQILIICGDFNSISFHPVLSKIKKHLKIINQQYENYSYTFPTNYPILQLDKCYSNESITNNFTLIKSKSDNNCMFSDHFPLINEFLIV